MHHSAYTILHTPLYTTGSPAAFVEKISRSNIKSELLIIPKLQKNDAEPSFTIVHYAGNSIPHLTTPPHLS